jgi:peptidyl-prolyl cis-trans isomerase B (cyclophilin B)
MKVNLVTNKGTITLKLDSQRAPETVKNFTQYVEDGFYDATLFHRVIDGFMIQGGGLESGLKQKAPRPPIRNEADNGLSNTSGTVAMARTNDPHSASSQFFINVADNGFLDHRAPSADGWGYCVFGEVSDGMDVVNAIKDVATHSVGRMQDVPVEEVVIEKAEIIA